MMRKILVFTLLVSFLFTMGIAFAGKEKGKGKGKEKKCVWEDPNTIKSNFAKNISWDKHKWEVVLKDGRLEIQMLKSKRKVLIDNGVNYFTAAGTGIGPIVVYKCGNELRYFHRKFKGVEGQKKTFYKGNIKGNVKKVGIIGKKDGIWIHVVAPEKKIYKYWIDEKGATLKLQSKAK